TGDVLGRKEEILGRVVVDQVAEAYSTARVSKGKGMAGGDRVRVSAGKVRLTILPLSTGVRDNLIEAAVQELVDGFTRAGRFQVGMGDPIGVALGQQGVSPEQALEGKGLAQAAEKFKVEHLLVVHFKRVETKPYMDVRFFSLPRTVPDVTTAFFVPPSIRPTQQGSRFSQGGPANPPQAKPRSLLARLLGCELLHSRHQGRQATVPRREPAHVSLPAGSRGQGAQERAVGAAVQPGEVLHHGSGGPDGLEERQARDGAERARARLLPSHGRDLLERERQGWRAGPDFHRRVQPAAGEPGRRGPLAIRYLGGGRWPDHRAHPVRSERPE